MRTHPWKLWDFWSDGSPGGEDGNGGGGNGDGGDEDGGDGDDGGNGSAYLRTAAAAGDQGEEECYKDEHCSMCELHHDHHCSSICCLFDVCVCVEGSAAEVGVIFSLKTNKKLIICMKKGR